MAVALGVWSMVPVSMLEVFVGSSGSSLRGGGRFTFAAAKVSTERGLAMVILIGLGKAMQIVLMEIFSSLM